MSDESIEQQLNDALIKLSITPERFRPVEREPAQAIIERAMATFVNGNPRTWWLSLKLGFVGYDYPDGNGYLSIASHIPNGDRSCWFIPETEEENLPVFDVTVREITRVMEECECFEYYLVGKDFSWLLIETDHNQVILSLA